MKLEALKETGRGTVEKIGTYLFPKNDPDGKDTLAAWTKNAFTQIPKEDMQLPSVLLESFQDILDVLGRAKSITVELAILHDPKTNIPREGTQYTVDDGSVRYVFREAYVCDPSNPSISALLRRDERVEALRKNSADSVEITYEEDKTPDTPWERIYAKHHGNSIHMAEVIQPVQAQEVFPLPSARRVQGKTTVTV